MIVNRTLVRTVDLETTDFPPEADVIEAGYVDTVLEREDEGLPWTVIGDVVRDAQQKFFRPDRTCSVKALSTHHITPDLYATADHHSTLNEWLSKGNPNVIVAHNADFEMKFISLQGVWWVDTYKVALRLFPDFDSHSNQYLRYALGLKLGDAAMPPHRALPDAYTTAHIFAHMLQIASLKDMVKWSADVPYLTKIGFGKHFGQKFEDVPRSYLTWILGQADMDPAVHAAARRVLNGEA